MTKFTLTPDTRHFDEFPTGFKGVEYYARLQELDKDLSPYFAGRNDILSQIEDNCVEIWRRQVSGQEQVIAATRVIYGAPGAGKTTTLRHLQQQWEKGSYVTPNHDGSARKGPPPKMLLFRDPDILYDPAGFCVELADLIVLGSGDTMFLSISDTKSVSAEASALFVKGSVEKQRIEQDRQSDSFVHTVFRTLLKTVPLQMWKQPIVIGIDETQVLSGDSKSSAGVLLRALHNNHYNLPLIVVMGGLSDSVTRVKQLGLTRPSKHHTHSLGCLDEVELKEFKTGFIEHFDLDLGSRERQFDAIIESSNGWPAHLQNGLQSFAKVYVEAQGDVEKGRLRCGSRTESS